MTYKTPPAEYSPELDSTDSSPDSVAKTVDTPVVKKKRGKGRPVVGKGNGKKLGPMSSYHREKIAKSQILKRLIEHAEGKLSSAGIGGNQEMSATQVTAALSLLDRVLPKLTQAQIEQNVTVEDKIEAIKIISVAPDKKKTGGDK